MLLDLANRSAWQSRPADAVRPNDVVMTLLHISVVCSRYLADPSDNVCRAVLFRNCSAMSSLILDTAHLQACVKNHIKVLSMISCGYFHRNTIVYILSRSLPVVCVLKMTAFKIQLFILVALLGLVISEKLPAKKSNKLRILGPQGPPGIQGSPGPPGPPGLPGQNGVPGSSGHDGPPGIYGPQGPQGNQGIQGPQGDKGSKGDPGAPGLTGLTGPIGVRGEKGDPGKPGSAGQKGLAGLPGFPGEPGFIGPKGAPGDQGLPGSPGPQGPPGLPGPYLPLDWEFCFCKKREERRCERESCSGYQSRYSCLVCPTTSGGTPQGFDKDGKSLRSWREDRKEKTN